MFFQEGKTMIRLILLDTDSMTEWCNDTMFDLKAIKCKDDRIIIIADNNCPFIWL
jgi:hypothetical protein